MKLKNAIQSLVLLAMILGCYTTQAQQSSNLKTLHATQAIGHIEIDGVLDEQS